MLKNSFSSVTDWVFDMDHTLYPAENALFSQIEVLMSDYFQQVTGLDRDQADKLRLSYWEKYGASLNGLIEHHNVDPDHFLHTVHQLDFSVLRPDPDLNTAINALPGRKFVFTNGPIAYANSVLKSLNLQDSFDVIYGIEHADLVPKPNPTAYDTIFGHANLDHHRAAMFEDSPQNLLVPHQLGMRTVLVHGQSDAEHVHFQTDCLKTFLNQVVI